ncbi:MAG: MaoC family dehydratase [Betaproteobacteria bacterium]|nr:MaoC family dehydratase [Betaproteobacteria bacterium]
MGIDFASVKADQPLPELKLPPINRTTLALFAGASGDHNPIHIDIDFARKAGMDDVFAQGMLPMAYLGRLLTTWVSPQRLRGFSARFAGITHLGDELTCSGRIVEQIDHDGERNGERLGKFEIQVVNQSGEVKITGEALIAF